MGRDHPMHSSLTFRARPCLKERKTFLWCFLFSLFNNENFQFTGKMKGLAFIQDPDGYWIEILNPNKMATLM